MLCTTIVVNNSLNHILLIMCEQIYSCLRQARRLLGTSYRPKLPRAYHRRLISPQTATLPGVHTDFAGTASITSGLAEHLVSSPAEVIIDGGSFLSIRNVGRAVTQPKNKLNCDISRYTGTPA